MNALFYAIGYAGLVLYVLTGAMEAYGKQLSAVSKYITENALPLIINLICYNVIVALWLWSDLAPVLGLDAGKSNALTPLVGYTAQSLFTKSVRNFNARSDKNVPPDPPTDPKA